MVLNKKPSFVPCCGAVYVVFIQLLIKFLFFFYVQELDLLFEFEWYCGSYGFVAFPIVAVYLNGYVVGR